MKHYNYTQAQFSNAVACLHAEITVSRCRPDMIVAPIRGGLVLGVYLSHLMDVPLVPIDPSNIARGLGGRILLVDDISDSGDTLSSVLETLKSLPQVLEVKTATLVYRDTTKVVPDYYDLMLDTPAWVVFPWEPQGE